MLPRSQLMLRAAAIIGDCHGDGFSRAGTAPLLRKRIAATGSTIMRCCSTSRMTSSWSLIRAALESFHTLLNRQ